MNPESQGVVKRPTNAVLTITALFKCLMSGFTGTVIAAALCLFNDRLPLSDLSLVFIGASTLAGFATFFATHFMEGKNRKAAFISAGGDPTGMNLFMFGSLRFNTV